MVDMNYKTRGTCARSIHLVIDDDGIVQQVDFTGGCSGNTKGVSALVKGRPAEEVVQLLKGTKCGFKSTSCPDQLALAIESAMAQA